MKKTLDDVPTKNKKRAQRRKRNLVAKEMLTKKKGGPMKDRRKELIDKAREMDGE